MDDAVLLFTRDLRVHDHPALAAAAREAERVTPLFVLDDGILRSDFARPNRVGFLLESLADVARALRGLGSTLVVRRGDVVAETVRLVREVGAAAVFASADVSAFARRRERRLGTALARERVELRLWPGVTAVPPEELAPAGGDHYRVFGAYQRAWRGSPLRPLEAPPRLRGRGGPTDLDLPELAELVSGRRSPELLAGGEQAGRKRLERWLDDGLARYDEAGAEPAADATSRLSPYLHFGCVSPLEVVERASRVSGGEAFVRQLCWRDFYHQLLAANAELPRADLRPRGDRWREDEDGLAAWKEGRTGIPIVDAGMRQLAREGWMHNRARLLAASFLVKDLYVDWREGACHFFDLLVDGDVANNAGNWQWVAGTGTDTRPNRIFNPLRQARRFDSGGDYVRRYVPELAEVEGPAVHEPWRLQVSGPAPDYPPPLVDHAEAARSFRARRAANG
jgi:deoxyribodipyrimidine photo-lyase